MAQTGTNAGPGTRATESPGNTGTNQTNMRTYPTGPNRPQRSTDCGPGSRASNDPGNISGSGSSTSRSSMASDCGSAGSSTAPEDSGAAKKR